MFPAGKFLPESGRPGEKQEIVCPQEPARRQQVSRHRQNRQARLRLPVSHVSWMP